MTIKQRIFPILACSTALFFYGCQSSPMTPKQDSPRSEPSPSKTVETPDGVVITPYDHPDIDRRSVPVKPPVSTSKSTQQFNDGRHIPAFQALMKQCQAAYAKAQWQEAENYALQAQRLAPQAAETFLYLAMVANQKNKPSNAEALAQRGLSYAQSNAMKKQLWNVILKAASVQKNTQKIQQARQALKSLS